MSDSSERTPPSLPEHVLEFIEMLRRHLVQLRHEWEEPPTPPEDFERFKQHWYSVIVRCKDAAAIRRLSNRALLELQVRWDTLWRMHSSFADAVVRFNDYFPDSLCIEVIAELDALRVVAAAEFQSAQQSAGKGNFIAPE